MPIQRRKEKSKNWTKLYEVCDRCDKARSNYFGGTVTHWLLGLQRCNCAPNEKDYVLTAGQQSLKDSHQVVGKSDPDPTREATIDLGARYEILETLGHGGMGTVYRVKDNVLEKEFAIKLLQNNFAGDPTAIKRFEREADAAASLTHPNLLATYGRGCATSGAYYIVMDLLKGEVLSELLKRTGKLGPARTINIAIQICDALAHAHMKGLIHRDLKPSNIMLTNKEGEPDAVKVFDFGISKLIPPCSRGTQNLTATGELLGSPSYMSPEQCLGLDTDERSDIYSLGCLMYEMLSGAPPFASKTPIQTVVKHLNEEAPPLKNAFLLSKIELKLQSIVMCCLEKDTVQRYQSMDQLKIDLLRVAGGKLPKRPKRRAIKTMPLSLPIASTMILLALWFNDIVNIVMLCSFFPCFAFTWLIALGQRVWNEMNCSTSGNSQRLWKIGSLASIMIGFFPMLLLCGLVLGNSLELNGGVYVPRNVTLLFLLTTMSMTIALLMSIGWALVNTICAFKLPRSIQIHVIVAYIWTIFGFCVFRPHLLAWIPYGSSLGVTILGLAHYQTVNLADSCDVGLELALLIDPNFADAYFRRAMSELESNPQRAIKDLSKAISLGSDELQVIALEERARLFESFDNWTDTISDLERLIQADPTTAGKYDWRIARCFYKAKRFKEALVAYTKIIDEPYCGDWRLFARRAKVYEQLGMLDRATSDYSSAIELEPNILNNYAHKAEALKRMGESRKALQTYQRLVYRFRVLLSHGRASLSSDYVFAAEAEAQLGHKQKARELLEEVVRQGESTNPSDQYLDDDYIPGGC